MSAGLWDWEREHRGQFDPAAPALLETLETRREWWADDLLKGSTAADLMVGNADPGLILKSLEDLVREYGPAPIW